LRFWYNNPVTTADATTVRSWARDNGFTASARGRLPAKVLDAYAAAHASPATAPSVKAVAKKAAAPASTGKTADVKATSQRTTAAVTAKKVSAAEREVVTLKDSVAATPDEKAPAKKAPAKKKAATKRAVTKTKVAKKTVTKKVAASVPARKASAARPASKAVAPKVPSTRPAKTAPPAVSPVPISSALPESSAAAVESVPLHRLVGLEKQVAALAARLAAVENASGAAGNDDAAPAAKPTRKFSLRH